MISGLEILWKTFIVYNQYMEKDIEFDNFRTNLLSAHSNYAWAPTETLSTIHLDSVQRKYECCGVSGAASDWEHARPESMTKDRLPLSCCPSMQIVFDTGLIQMTTVRQQCYSVDSFKVGCLAKYSETQSENLTLSIRNLILIVAQIIASRHLAQQRRNSTTNRRTIQRFVLAEDLAPPA